MTGRVARIAISKCPLSCVRVLLLLQWFRHLPYKTKVSKKMFAYLVNPLPPKLKISLLVIIVINSRKRLAKCMKNVCLVGIWKGARKVNLPRK